MKALHVMYVYGRVGTGGAAAAATRLHESMCAKGIDSRVVCVWNQDRSPDPRVSVLRTGWWWLGVRLLHKLTGRWTHALDLPGFDHLVRTFAPDEVHVHWIRRDTISWRQLGRLNAQVKAKGRDGRMYVHLHDLWALEQPQITEQEPTFVAYSDFAERQVRIRGFAVERQALILDPVFTSQTSQPRQSHDKVILFGCKDGRANPDKGFEDLARALTLLPETLKKNLELRIFGESGDPCDTSGVRTVFLGDITDPAELKRIYRSAVCFAFPSTHETMGLTKLEALACGTPVVAFDREACAEGIVHCQTGYVARDGDIEDYAKGLLRYAL